MNPIEVGIHHAVMEGIKDAVKWIWGKMKQTGSLTTTAAAGTTRESPGVEPVLDECPDGYPIKANESGIYHVPGGHFYSETTPKRCFATEADAEAAGYRKSQRG